MESLTRSLSEPNPHCWIVPYGNPPCWCLRRSASPGMGGVWVPPVHGVPLVGSHHLGVAGEPFSPHPRRPRELCPSQRLPYHSDLELAGVLCHHKTFSAEIADCREAPCTLCDNTLLLPGPRKAPSPTTARFLLRLPLHQRHPPLPHRVPTFPVSAVMADDASRLAVLTCLSLISTSPIPSQNLGLMVLAIEDEFRRDPLCRRSGRVRVVPSRSAAARKDWASGHHFVSPRPRPCSSTSLTTSILQVFAHRVPLAPCPKPRQQTGPISNGGGLPPSCRSGLHQRGGLGPAPPPDRDHPDRFPPLPAASVARKGRSSAVSRQTPSACHSHNVRQMAALHNEISLAVSDLSYMAFCSSPGRVLQLSESQRFVSATYSSSLVPLALIHSLVTSLTSTVLPSSLSRSPP
jgi:hypothetical protein